jgi:hypothetical protein
MLTKHQAVTIIHSQVVSLQNKHLSTKSKEQERKPWGSVKRFLPNKSLQPGDRAQADFYRHVHFSE